jgi:peptidoglycan/xylan/chitin deacetylase (PgdA/CDA1 family)
MTVLRRRHLQRRTGAVVALVATLGLAVALIPRGDDQPEAVSTEGGARVSALERSLAGRPQHEDAVKEALGYTEFVKQGIPVKRQVALTFDDGPGPYTNQILEILRKSDTPATFFVLGGMVDDFPDLVPKELRQGHAIGAHTFDHPRMGELPLNAQFAQMADFEAAMEEHNLPVPHIFRPPYGSFNADTITLLEHRNTLMVLWSVDTGDYLDPGSEVIAERALEGAEPGAIILLHDAGGDRTETITALPKIIRGLKRKRLQPVTVPELLVDDPPPRDQTLEQASALATEGNQAPLVTP